MRSCGAVLCSFFFFSSRRRHTRSTRDWSSDVCSSDLAEDRRKARVVAPDHGDAALARALLVQEGDAFEQLVQVQRHRAQLNRARQIEEHRSEERRVGKECRTRWSPCDEKKKRTRKKMC